MNENEKNERETIDDWLAEQDMLDEEPAKVIVKKEKVKAPVKETVLHEAERIIYGDRERTYGHPSKNLWTIARLWTAYVDAASDNALQGKEFTAKDVALMMILVKTARLANNDSHRDSVVDICGYAALMERCDE
jgi:hypothetical protein